MIALTAASGVSCAVSSREQVAAPGRPPPKTQNVTYTTRFIFSIKYTK